MPEGSALLTRITGQGVLHFLVAPPFSLLSGGDGRARRLRGLSVPAVAVVALLVAASVTWVLMVDAQDATVQLVKNTDKVAGPDLISVLLGNNAVGQGFTTGPNPHGYPARHHDIANSRLVTKQNTIGYHFCYRNMYSRFKRDLLSFHSV